MLVDPAKVQSLQNPDEDGLQNRGRNPTIQTVKTEQAFASFFAQSPSPLLIDNYHKFVFTRWFLRSGLCPPAAQGSPQAQMDPPVFRFAGQDDQICYYLLYFGQI